MVSLAGFADATYLTVQHLRGVDVGCTVIAGCEQVLTSSYAEVAGIPTALFGALFYLAVFVLTMTYVDTRRLIVLRLALWLTVPGFLVTLVLLYLQAFVIGYWCQFCLVSALTSSVLFFLSVWLLRQLRDQAGAEKRLVMATGNAGKVAEIQHILASLNIPIVSAATAGVVGHAEEDGETLEENALKKARYVAHRIHVWVAADDTGLFIDALNGEPGVRSARYAGIGASDDHIRDFILTKMSAVPDNLRLAHFTSVIALISPTGQEWTFTGTLAGRITARPSGGPRRHLPYDQIFIPEGSEKTLAEYSDIEKNQISHRRKAFDQLRNQLERELRLAPRNK
ncbi:MAG: RdgB/HAM1 family non-canonical purine NTP pyrophosphatase [Candidatus Kerfeldbacteria bacterium]|nr:RdgB/HAM1 family non-canonical purine NTP pyrophosphatase [Candidatus Kerfeldbacteria bacterium]